MKAISRLDDLIAELCPDGVEYKSLAEIGEFYGGLTGKTKEDFTDGNAKFVTYMNVFSNIAVNVEIDIFVKVDNCEKQHTVHKGDVLFTGSSETSDECGMSSVMTRDMSEPLYLNSFCFGLRLYDPSILLPDFSKYLFRSDELRKQITKTASGVTRFNVSKKKMARVVAPIPPLPIQQEIVRILDKFTTLEAELEAELEARGKQYQYYRENILIYAQNNDTYNHIHIGGENGLCDYLNGKAHEGDISETGDYIVVNSKFISTDGKVKKYSDRQICPVDKNDVLMVLSDLPNGKALAKCFFVERDNGYTLNQRICALKVIDRAIVSPKYLYYTLNRNRQLLKYDNGVDQTNLKKEHVLSVIVPIPPIADQERIVAILDRFDALVNDITSGLPAEIAARRKQYEYYRDKLLTFEERAS